MFDRTFPSDETRNDLSDPVSPNGMGTFYRAEAPRPDTVAPSRGTRHARTCDPNLPTLPGRHRVRPLNRGKVRLREGERRRVERDRFSFINLVTETRTSRRTIMFGLNNAQLIGRLGADVTVNHLANGGRVANLSIATDESYIDKNSGDRVDRTEWHRGRDFPTGLGRYVREARPPRAAWSTSRASSRPGAGRRTARTPTGSRPRSFWSRAAASSSWTRATGSNGNAEPAMTAAAETPMDDTDEIPF